MCEEFRQYGFKGRVRGPRCCCWIGMIALKTTQQFKKKGGKERRVSV